MKKVLAWTIGGLILLGLTFVSILSVNDAYVTITALRGAGSPGTMTITSSERNWRVFFTTCFAEAVSYTHLDVYKRQSTRRRTAGSRVGRSRR